VPEAEVNRYGMVDAVDENGLLRLRDMVEKPAIGESPSDLAMIGRYIFTPRLLELLASTERGVGGEIQLTDASARLAHEEPVYGVLIEGERFDAGNPLGFLTANTILGLRHPEFGDALRSIIKKNL
jgi:UTP--glucose-1-phosphate uridylyltransferase